MTPAAERLRDWGAHTAIVLGSGLSSIVSESTDAVVYGEFTEIPKPTVAGHPGKFVLNGKIIYALGRVHLYEGHAASDAVSIVRVLARAGVNRIVFTNAAGSLNPSFAPGSWMMISDHLNLTGTTPLLGTAQFIDMTDVYSARWRGEFRDAARELGIALHEGVYAGLLGPQYETPAEVRMLRTFGADAVGMSTVLEVIAARALGLEVAGFSCLANWAAGIGTQPLSHDEVLEVGVAAATEFARLVSRVL